MTERFKTIPFTPEALPSKDYHVSNKLYVDKRSHNIVSTSIDLAMSSRNVFVIADDTNSSISIALPTVSVNLGKEIFIFNRVGSNIVYVRDGDGGSVLSQKAVGTTTTLAMSTAFETLHMVNDSVYWYDLNAEVT